MTNKDEPAKLEGVGSTVGLAAIAEDDALLEIGRQAIETTLIDWRDNRLSEFARGNGLVIREKDGSDSSVIRFGAETALRIGLKAIAEHLAANDQVQTYELEEIYNAAIDGEGKTVFDGLRAVVMAEREACAKVCDEWHMNGPNGAGIAADRIRRRSTPNGGESSA